MGARLRTFAASVGTLAALAAFDSGCTDKKPSPAPPGVGGQAAAGAAGTGQGSNGTSAGSGVSSGVDLGSGGDVGSGGVDFGSGGDVGTGGFVGSGGIDGSGGYLGTGGVDFGTGGFIGSGGVDFGTGGFIGSGGVDFGTGGFIGTGGVDFGTGGFIGTGGVDFGTGGFIGTGGVDFGTGGHVGSGGVPGAASTSASPHGLITGSGGTAGFVLCPTTGAGTAPATADALRVALTGRWLSCLYTFRGGEDGDALGTQGDGIELKSDGRYWHLTRNGAGQLTGIAGVDSEGDVSYGLSPSGAPQVTFRSDLNQVLSATPLLTAGPTVLIIRTANAEHRYIPAP